MTTIRTAPDHSIRPLILLTMSALLALGVADLQAQEVVIDPAKDNTLYESGTGSVSNGAGSHLFVGSNGQGSTRRALLKFDVASVIPAGATIESATLEMNMSRTTSGAASIALHRVLADWGEGASDAAGNEGSGAAASPGDATWLHTFFDTTAWQSPGGDFAPTSSVSTSVSAPGPYSWVATAAMLEDVTLWLEQPDQNFGWVFIGDEDNAGTAKRFDSRENAIAASRPRLRVTYTVTTASESEEVPAAAELHSIWPNPFNRETRLAFTVERPTHVRIDVFSVLGQPVMTVENRDFSAGSFTTTWSATDLPSGVYYMRFSAGAYEEVRSLVRVD